MTVVDVERDTCGGGDAAVVLQVTDGAVHVAVSLSDAEANDLGCALADAVDQERLVVGDQEREADR